MLDQGIGSWPRRRARAMPDRTALIHGDQHRTYRELYERTTALAHALRAHGVRARDRVAYLGPNHPALLEMLFATASLGAVFVPLNTRLAPAELAYILDDAEPTILAVSPEHASTPEAIPAAIAGIQLVSVEQDGVGDRTGGPRANLEDWIAAASREPLAAATDPDEARVLLYTSGTTGRPKGAMLSSANLTWNCLNVLVDVDLHSEDVVLVNAPLFHAAALGMNCLPALLKGACVVLAPRFEAAESLELIERHRVTHGFGVPTMFEAMTRSTRWPTTDLSSVRFLLCGGSPVPESLAHTYLERDIPFLQGYGMTEASPGVLLLTTRDARRKAGSAGTPAFFTDIAVRSADGQEYTVDEPESAMDTVGEIVVSGPNVSSGYWRRPEATAESFTPSGAFRTGDIAHFDAEGFGHIVDRATAVIISGGENIYPAEVERELAAHPAVGDCAVFGRPDQDWGEVAVTVVVPAPGERIDEAALLAHLRARIAHYKVPKDVLEATELPRNSTGKLDRAALRRDFG